MKAIQFGFLLLLTASTALAGRFISMTGVDPMALRRKRKAGKTTHRNEEDGKAEGNVNRHMLAAKRASIPQAEYWSWDYCYNPQADYQKRVVNAQFPHVPQGYVFLAGGGYKCGEPPVVRNGTIRMKIGGLLRGSQRLTTMLPIVKSHFFDSENDDPDTDPECIPYCFLGGLEVDPKAFIDGQPVDPQYFCDEGKHRLGYCPPTNYTTFCDSCDFPLNDTSGYCQGACEDPNEGCFGCKPSLFNNCKSLTSGLVKGSYFDGYWLIDEREWKLGDSHEFHISSNESNTYCSAVIVNITAVAY